MPAAIRFSRLNQTRGSSLPPNGSPLEVRPSLAPAPAPCTCLMLMFRPMDITATMSPGRIGSLPQDGTRGSVTRIVTSVPHG
jgi:hypothetical protein